MTYLQTNYLTICNHLGLDCSCPFSVEVEGVVISAPCLISKLGGSLGTIIVLDYDDLKGKGRELGNLGYGWSVLDDHDKLYSLDDLLGLIEMFCEWGWASPEPKPDWYFEFDELSWDEKQS